MKINLSDIDLENFSIKEGIFCGIKSFLVTPKLLSVKYNHFNKFFRSSIWDENGQLLSAGFYKFCNAGEQEDVFPMPKSLKNTHILDKIDGSLCICDYVNDIFSMRTRGVFDYKVHENSADFDFCLNKYPMVKNWGSSNSNYSLLLEITSPRLKIVLDYGDKPNFTLVGIVNKNNYELLTQHELDELAVYMRLPRPQVYNFNNIEELTKGITDLQDKEGCVLYSSNDTVLHKLKSARYLMLHKLKSELKSIENLIDLFTTLKYPNYLTFKNYIETTFDHEIFLMVQGDLSKICDAYKNVLEIIDGFQNFLDNRKELDRKNLALQVLSSYGNTNRASFLFELKDKGKLSDNSIKKLLFQCLKR